MFTVWTHYPRSFSTLSTKLSTILVFMGVFRAACMWKTAKTGTSAALRARERSPCDPFRYFTQRPFTDYEVGAFLQGDGASPASFSDCRIRGQTVCGDVLPRMPIGGKGGRLFFSFLRRKLSAFSLGRILQHSSFAKNANSALLPGSLYRASARFLTLFFHQQLVSH